jgi:hypothetical protein
MTCLPREGDLDRTVLETMPVQNTGKWWTGVVRDRDHESGEIRIRLERWVDNDHGPDNPHTWRIRPDYWAEEREAVEALEQGRGRAAPSDLSINGRYTPREYIPVRNESARRVAVVRLKKKYGESVRLYHWDPTNGAVRQKFTTGKYWSDLVKLADDVVYQVA